MAKHRFPAQALVEFSLVIVLLLVLIFGILEVGRFLFIKAAVITSSREAARYGSAAGKNEAGTLYYQDCAGIRNAAKRVAFFIKDSEIEISFDKGPDNSITVYCQLPKIVDEGPAYGDRIRVAVNTKFYLIVPIVPIGDQNGEIETGSFSARTILGIIKLE